MMRDLQRWWLRGLTAAATLLLVGLSGCYTSSSPEGKGGETHFLQACDGKCGAGFSCVCGVCTQECESSSDCITAGSHATCIASDGVGDTRSCADAEDRKRANVCDVRCVSDEDCGDQTTCSAGLCRERAVAATTGKTAAVTSTQLESAPIVMLLIDTSGSMERRPNCTCTTPGCTECLVDCPDSDVTRWTELLGAVTGSFVDYSCERLERTAENGATYDVGYYLPFHRIGGGTRQRDDGVLGLYGSRLRFGLATFDTMETYLGANPLVHARSFDLATSSGVEGMFSYGGSADSRTERVRLDGNIAGRFYYPSGAEDYFIDTGVRAPDAAEGGLRLLATLDPRDDSMRALKRELLETRPYGGTPSAAALDDLYYYFDGDEHGLPRAKTPSAQGRYVVLVTDGYPDNDYRSYGCDCKAEGNCPDGEDPDRMICPYPTMTEAARRLRCGFTDGQCDEGPIDAVYVVGLEIPEHEQAIGNGTTDATRVVLNEAAAAGGTTEARFATDQVTLRDELRKIMDEILARRSAFP